MEALVGWLDLLNKGMKTRRSTLNATSDQNWTIGSEALSYPTPPVNYNQSLIKRYCNTLAEEGFPDLTNTQLAKHPDDHHVLSKFYLLQKKRIVNSPAHFSEINIKRNVIKRDSTKSHNKNKQLCLSSIAAPQPAAAKSSPLPPFIDENKLYRVPPNTSTKLIQRLQRPRTFPILQSDHPKQHIWSSDEGLSDYQRLVDDRRNDHNNMVQLGQTIGSKVSSVGTKRILPRPSTASGKALLDVLKGQQPNDLMEVGVLGHLKKEETDTLGPGQRSILRDLQLLGLEFGQPSSAPAPDTYARLQDPERSCLLGLIRGESGPRTSWTADPAIVLAPKIDDASRQLENSEFEGREMEDVEPQNIVPDGLESHAWKMGVGSEEGDVSRYEESSFGYSIAEEIWDIPIKPKVEKSEFLKEWTAGVSRSRRAIDNRRRRTPDELLRRFEQRHQREAIQSVSSY